MLDIDECAEGQSDCESKCTNTEGGYECSCPFGTKGDGRRRPSGSGCKRLPPLDIVLGNLFFRVCPYIYIPLEHICLISRQRGRTSLLFLLSLVVFQL